MVELNIKGKKGQKVTVSHAETLDKDGVFYPETLRKAKSIDEYVLNGKKQVLFPKFTFMASDMLRLRVLMSLLRICLLHL